MRIFNGWQNFHLKKHPNKINTLLESTSLVKNKEDRIERIKSDQLISDNILNNFRRL